MATVGELRSDQWDLVWVFTGDTWAQIYDTTGIQLTIQDPAFIKMDIFAFTDKEDPTRRQQDPRFAARLDRIEQKLDRLLDVPR